MRNRFGGHTAMGLIALALLTTQPAGAQSLADWLGQGKVIVDARARYETVDDQSKTLTANAATLRARLGYETAAWNGLSLAFDFDGVFALAANDYNSTRNGKTAYPTVGDPNLTTLNRLQLTYASDFDTKLIVGRQRLQLGDQRFVGNSAWRQHEQTFDAITLVNSSIKELTFAYSYLERVNRVYGPNHPTPATGPVGHFDSNSHLFNALYTGLPHLKLEGYVYLLDLGQQGPAASVLATSKLSTATYGARGEYRAELVEGLTGQINAAFAHQQNYAANPLRFDLDYWLTEASLSYHGFTATLGNEVMGGNGTNGFSTPLASLHPFDGLADMFTTTPVYGIGNLYGKAAYVLAAPFGLKSLTGIVAYHDFTADRTDVGIGHEWDATLELAVDQHTSFLVGVADYHGAGVGLGGFANKTVVWLQGAYKL